MYTPPGNFVRKNNIVVSEIEENHTFLLIIIFDLYSLKCKTKCLLQSSSYQSINQSTLFHHLHT